MAATDRRETESGIEVKPVYTPPTRRARSRRPGESPFTRGPYRRHVPRPAVDDPAVRGLRLGRGVERALPLPARARADGALGRVRPADAARLRLRRSARATARSAAPASRSTRSPTWRSCSRASRSTDVSTSMTINAPASLLLLLYELVAETQGVGGAALRGTVQNDILKEYIARGNYIFPPRPSMRLTTDLFAYCAERIPQWNTISISGYHIREAGSTAVQELAFTLANGIAYCEAAVDAGLVARRVRRAALVLLQRAQRLLPGGGEVPRGAAAVGARHARALRRDEPEGARAALPRADRRLDADGAAAGEQHRPRRDPGALGGVRRCAVAAHELVRRGARAADASTRRRSRCARSRSSQNEAGTTATADPLGGSYYVEALTDELEARAVELIERIDELGGAVAAVEAGLGAGRDRGRRRIAWTARGRGGRARDRRRQRLCGRARESRDRAAPPRSRSRAAPARAHGAAFAPSATPTTPSGARRGARGGARHREPAAADARRACVHAARSARSAACCARSGASTTGRAVRADPPRLADVPGPGRPGPRRVRRAARAALRERGHEIELAVLDRRGGGKRRFLELRRSVRAAGAARRRRGRTSSSRRG